VRQRLQNGLTERLWLAPQDEVVAIEETNVLHAVDGPMSLLLGYELIILSNDDSGRDGLPGSGRWRLHDPSRERPAWVTPQMLHDVEGKRRPGLLVQPPVVVQDERPSERTRTCGSSSTQLQSSP
jgi:hypothetical protein